MFAHVLCYTASLLHQSCKEAASEFQKYATNIQDMKEMLQCCNCTVECHADYTPLEKETPMLVSWPSLMLLMFDFVLVHDKPPQVLSILTDCSRISFVRT